MSFLCLGNIKFPDLFFECIEKGFKQLKYYPNINLNSIKNFPDTHWVWKKLSLNENLDNNIFWDFVNQNPNKDWDYTLLSHRNFIKWSVIKNNPNKNWDWEELNENVPWNFLNDNIDLPWDFNALSVRIKKWEHQHWEVIKNNPNKNWDWKKLSRMVHYEFLNDNIDLPWNFNELSFWYKSEYEWEVVDKNFNKPWSWFILSAYEPPLWFIKKHLDKPFSFENLSSYVDIDIIRKHPNLEWNFRNRSLNFDDYYYNSSVYDNSNITWEQVKNNPQLPWNYKYLHEKFTEGFIDWDYIIKNINKGWDLVWLSKQPNIPVKFLIAMFYIKKGDYVSDEKIRNDYIFRNLCINTNLHNKDIIENYFIPWNYEDLEKNIFLKKNQSANIIQNYWNICRYNPKFKMCMKVQMQNFCNIIEESGYYEKICKDPIKKYSAIKIQKCWKQYLHRKNNYPIAALVIQKFWRDYQKKKKLQEKACLVIQNYWRKQQKLKKKKNNKNNCQIEIFENKFLKKITIYKINIILKNEYRFKNNSIKLKKDIKSQFITNFKNKHCVNNKLGIIKINNPCIYSFMIKKYFNKIFPVIKKKQCYKKNNQYKNFYVKNGKLYRYTKLYKLI